MVFVVATVLAMGFLAMGYGQLTRSMASKATTRIIYYCSCGLSILFGVVWLLVAYAYRAEGGVDAFLHGHSHGGDTKAESAFIMFSALR
eukprot:6457608-Amphidinium_carterae.2